MTISCMESEAVLSEAFSLFAFYRAGDAGAVVVLLVSRLNHRGSIPRWEN